MEHVDIFSGVIVPFVNFVVFCFLLVLFAKKPLAAIFAKKRADYLQAVAEGQKTRQAAEEQNQRLQQQLKDLEKSVEQIRTEAKAEAEAQAHRIITDAQKVADSLETEARRLAANELEKARTELNNEIVQHVQTEVTKLIGEQLDNHGHLKIIKERQNQLQRFS